MLSTGDFAQLNEFVMSTWTNDIAVQSINQDPLGIPARRIDNVSAIGPGTILPRGSPTTAVQLQQHQHHDTTTDQGLGASSGSGKNVALMTVGECGGEPEDQQWTVNAKGFLANAATDTCINVIADAWGHCSILIYDSCTAIVANSTGPDGKCLAHSMRWAGSPLNSSTGQLVGGGSDAPTNMCATEQGDKTVKLSRCIDPSSSPPATQKWKYDTGSKQLTTGDGVHCVTASNPKTTILPITLVVGRPLGLEEPHSYAMVFLNNRNSSMNVTCDATCMANMLALKPNATSTAETAADTQEQEELVLYEVQEVWSGGKVLAGVGPLKCSKTSCEPLTVGVLPHGGTTYVRLVPTKHHHQQQQNATRSSTRSTRN